MRVDKRQILCIVLGISFFFAGLYVDKGNSILKEGHLLARNSYGEGDKEQELKITGLTDQELPIVLTLGERAYDKGEAEAVFLKAGESLDEIILKENQALNRVKTDLNLVTWLPEYGISVRWESENPELIESSGRVHGQDCPFEGTDCLLTAVLRAGEYSRSYEIKARVQPEDLTSSEKERRDYEALLLTLDQEQRGEEYLALPKTYEGRPLTYRVKPSADYFIFPVLGVLAAVLLPLRDRQKEKTEKKKRERQMLLDYSEIVSRLAVFLGAGLPVRKAWERIVLDYENKIGANGEPRFAYEEMKSVYYLMGRGMSELRAYTEFGNRCGLLPYRKLAGLLEQNVKHGAERLGPILEAEMEAAFEQRKSLARKIGEEAGTKLLLPLFLLLGVVMAMITVPAFLSFGF